MTRDPWTSFGLPKPSMTELLAMITVIASGAAAIYNFGFFLPIQWSLISLLTLQDIFTGALISIPIGMVGISMLTLTFFLLSFESKPVRISCILALIVAASAFVVFLHMTGDNGRNEFTVIYASWLFVVFIASNQDKFKYKYSAPWFYTAILVLTPGVIGFVQANDAIASEHIPNAVVSFEDETSPREIRIIRASSSYLFFDEGHGIEVVPMTRVNSIVKPLVGRSLNG